MTWKKQVEQQKTTLGMTRDQRREAMPECARILDDFAAVFGPVKVQFAEEAGYVFGSPGERGVNPITVMQPRKKNESGTVVPRSRRADLPTLLA